MVQKRFQKENSTTGGCPFDPAQGMLNAKKEVPIWILEKLVATLHQKEKHWE